MNELSSRTMRTLGIDARREALRGSPLFKSLTREELDAVLARSVIQRFARGAVILRQGDSAASMMVVVQGRVRLSLSGAEGHEISLGVLGPGEVVGEMALLDGGERSTTVTGVDEGVLLVIPRADFLPLLEGSASLCIRLMQVLCARLRRANLSVEEMATLDVGARLARLLMRLAESYGTRRNNALRLDLKLSQKDISTLIGASREKVNKQLRQWEQDGILSSDHGYLVIGDPAALAGIAG